jgi:hypothetical protein
MDSILGALKVVAVVAVIGGAGYLAVTQLGWESTLELVGIQTTTLAAAPDSQCARARDQSTEDYAVRCISDREWLRTFIDACAKGEESGLAIVGPDGVLRPMDTCPRGQRGAARARVGAPIPRDYRVADLVGSLRAE